MLEPMPLPRKFYEEHNDTYCDLPGPSFWMNLPPRVIHKLKNGLSGSEGSRKLRTQSKVVIKFLHRYR